MAEADTDVEISEGDDIEGGEEEEAPPQQAASEEQKDGEGTESDASEEGVEEGEEPAPKPDADDPEKLEVPVRSSAVASHIIARQKQKIEKLRKGKDEEAGEEEAEDSDGDELSPEALRAIDKRLGRAINPLISRLTAQADTSELSTFIQSTPEAKGYEKRIKKVMEHEAYRNVPPLVIFHHLAFQNAQKLGAKKRENADREASHSRTGGNRTTPKKGLGKLTPEAINAMSEAEITELGTKVLTGDI